MSTDTHIDIRRRRALYRAMHRGTKEMDWLLGKYAEAKLPVMDSANLTLFEQFLAIADPDLNAWILDPALIEGRQFEGMVADVRAFHALVGTLSAPMTGQQR